MGANPARMRRKARLKRARRQEERLAAKVAAKGSPVISGKSQKAATAAIGEHARATS